MPGACPAFLFLPLPIAAVPNDVCYFFFADLCVMAGAEVYPRPGLVTLMPTTLPMRLAVAEAAVVKPPPVKVMAGAEV